MIPTTLNRLGLSLALLGLQPATRAAESYPPNQFPDASGWGHHIQRTMRLLATSTPEQRHTVRLLFYGQSITEETDPAKLPPAGHHWDAFMNHHWLPNGSWPNP